MSDPTIVCVLGMHRSGTSLVTRLLNVLGLELGPTEHLMRPSSANPAGHWESLPVKEINDEILEHLGGSWFDPPEFTPGWESAPELADARRRARDLIASDFSDAARWGFKDPRVCLTAPFWQRLIGPMRYLVCIRNPIDVAASLAAREVEPIPFEQGVELWLTYTRAALAASAGHPRELLFYEDLMAEPEPVVERLARFIGSTGSDTADTDTQVAIRVAVSEGLWHHRSAVPNVVDAARLPFPVKALYLALRLFEPGPERIGDETVELFGAYAAGESRRRAQLEAGREELARVREHLEEVERRREALERQLSEREAELERAATARAEEEQRREALEAELEERRAEAKLLREADAARLKNEAARASASERRSIAMSSPDGSAAEVRLRAEELIPSGSTVLVAAKGDDALLELPGSRGLHFPAAADGRYAGYHPAGDTAVIAQLEARRARGADHLLLPATTLWWLDHYQGLRRHLEERYEPLLNDGHCAIYRLDAGERRHLSEPLAMLKDAVASIRVRTGRDPSILDWHSGLGVGGQLPDLLVFEPPDDHDPALPYMAGTVDIVVLATADHHRVEEARRVAASALIRVDPGARERATLDWLGHDPGWGEDVSVTLFPRGDDSGWPATLAAVAETLEGGFAGELTLVGDRSGLESASEPGAAAGLRTRSIEVAPGASIADRARAAIEGSDGSVHALVTEPAVPLPDWLPSVVPLVSGERDAGVVGARILSDDGALEEAGGILDDGRRRRRGEGDSDPDRPEYRFVQRVDFCSPPLLATRRDVFERLGGFDARHPATADAVIDFSLRAGRSGAPVYYQPQARVVAMGSEAR